MKAVPHLLLLMLPALSILSHACRPMDDLDDASRIAEVSIRELENQDYTSYQFAMQQQDGDFVVPRTSLSRGQQGIHVKVPVGTYKFSLEYYKDKDLTLSSAFCGDGVRNDIQTLVAGPNDINLAVCTASKEPAGSTVVIKPVPGDGSKPGTPLPPVSETFTIQNGQLLDASGKAFVFRGINIPFAYYFDQSFSAIENARTTGFNSVRIVWCADNYLDGTQRCQVKDQRSAAELDRVLTKLDDQKLVTLFNLQNATGDNTVESLQKMADYLVRDDIKAVLMKHKKSVLINIANEWLGDWTKNRTWVDGYRAVIPRLRKAGLPHVLVIDARGYGQDFSSIEESAAELLVLDKNLLFSSHMYAVYSSDQIVQEKLKYIREKKIPYIIGEFGCTHYDDATAINRPVACEAILRETASTAAPIGTVAWSYAGNRQLESDLDVFSAADWKTLTAYGMKVVNGQYGAKATARQACFFDSMLCK